MLSAPNATSCITSLDGVRAAQAHAARPMKCCKQCVNHLAEAEDYDSHEYIYSINAISSDIALPHARVTVDNIELNMLIDTGASINVIDEEKFTQFHPTLFWGKTKILAYGSTTKIFHLGQFDATHRMLSLRRHAAMHLQLRRPLNPGNDRD